ncbi:RNA polymerase sigma factor [Dyadobacter aurulentus]|uniref:RNA polymerase sigma factor n=1 Tax=Dyadobacter sp. UC 10 TaxID=2605428 RepID=UPI0011F0F14E|nr:sigma-70 family RNA polymerase sigma factor [Dyadobacter sp. UC 10]KAA0992824.1 sigma-70 family RNA polymerase sigma factor [Dyadobacter sp. UC 10]
MKLSFHRTDAPDDNSIWQRFIEGDVNAFEQLMSIHFQGLFHYGSKFSRDREFVKDAIQDLFLILWEKRQNLGRDVAVKPYLMASLRRLMHRSQSARFPMLDISGDSREANFEIAFSVEQDYIEHESTIALASKLKHLLDQLPTRQKEVIYLKFFQEMDRSQISEIMDISPQTVSNLLQIAIKQLKNYWGVTLPIFFLMHLFI